MCKVLFVYPNDDGYPIIPIGISILSGILKKEGHEIDLYDITFKVSRRLDHLAREKTGAVKRVDFEKYWGKGVDFDIEGEYAEKLRTFKPDLIAFSIVENNYGCAKKLFKLTKEITQVPILVGGTMPTAAPEFYESDNNVDIICNGEGEYAMIELCKRLDRREDYSDIPNLFVRKNGKMIKNASGKYYDWEPHIVQDWTIFDPRHVMKAFDGKMWRTGFFEMSRGCPFGCKYCVNHQLQEKFKELGRFHREKPLDYVMDEIEYCKDKYNLELVFFNDENWLMMGFNRFEEFCEKYTKRIGLPYFIQTRPETCWDEKRVRMLKESNCITVAMGVESGNPKIRSMVLKRNTSDQVYIQAFANCNKYDIRTTAYTMLGMPYETEEDILQTAEFCKKLKARTIAASIFAPYHGTDLYHLCVKEGYIDERYYENISVNYTTILNMPQLPKEKLEELYYKFSSLVYADQEVVTNQC